MDANIPLLFPSSAVTSNKVWISALAEYGTMLNWLADRDILYTLEWDKSGKYLPISISMNSESASCFRLVFDV